MIKGLHHVSMKCRLNQLEKVRDFYCRVLELPICAEWDKGFLLDTPAGKVEFFTDAQDDLPKGTIRHFAFEVDNVDFYINKCKENGYEIFMGPKDVVLDDIKARVAFCYGPIGEEVEFFEVRGV